MDGYNLFLEKLEKLDLKKQKEVIAKIFNLEIVYLYSVETDGDGNIIFKIYDGRYYQFKFNFSIIKNNKFLDIVVKERIVLCDIYLKNFFRRDDNFSKFVRVLLEWDISYLDSFFNGWWLYSLSSSLIFIGR